jgi:hypothetical protein
MNVTNIVAICSLRFFCSLSSFPQWQPITSERASEIKDGAASLKTANSLAQVCAVIDYVREDFSDNGTVHTSSGTCREGGTHRTKEKIQLPVEKY